MSSPAQTTLQKLLDETMTHPKIKQTLKLITRTRQKISYHALVSSTQTYLQLRGLANHDHEEFNYINKMMHSRIVGVLAKIKRKEVAVRDLEEEVREAQEQKLREQSAVNEEIIAEVQHVINNIDLPLSLFKRNDKYWYQDNPKTIQAKNYVHERMKQDRQRKNKIRSEIMKRESEKEKMERQRAMKQMKEEQERRKNYKEEVIKRVQNYKKRSLERAKSIEDSEKYTASLKPLYLKLQQSQAMSQATALEQQKKRLSELRKLHKSIDVAEIQEHKNRLLQIQREKQIKKIFDEPVKVSYKSKYHTSMTARSRVSEYETTKSLYEKKKEYGEIVKNQFQPKIDDELVQEMEERLKLMKRKRVRRNPKKKEPKKKKGDGQDDDDDQDEQQEEPEPEKKQSPPKDDSDYDSDEDDDEKVKRPPLRKLGEDDDYDRSERYQLGVQYLQYARSVRKKKQGSQIDNQSKQDPTEPPQPPKQQKSKTSQRYKDYLKQFTHTNRTTIDHIDTTRMKQQYNKSIIDNNNKKTDYTNLSKLENTTRIVEEKIRRQEELLRFKKMKNQDAVSKKVQIDNAVVETIKARLAMMGR